MIYDATVNARLIVRGYADAAPGEPADAIKARLPLPTPAPAGWRILDVDGPDVERVEGGEAILSATVYATRGQTVEADDAATARARSLEAAGLPVLDGWRTDQADADADVTRRMPAVAVLRVPFTPEPAYSLFVNGWQVRHGTATEHGADCDLFFEDLAEAVGGEGTKPVHVVVPLDFPDRMPAGWVPEEGPGDAWTYGDLADWFHQVWLRS